MNYGFVKVAVAIPQVRVADCTFNAEQIVNLIAGAGKENVQIAGFPELCITGYTCGDLFAQPLLLHSAEAALARILSQTQDLDVTAVLGMPVAVHSSLINAAVVIQKGRILGVVPKTYLPNYKEFYERRWFTSAFDVNEKTVRLCGQLVPLGANMLFEASNAAFGVEICEDLWSVIPPSSTLALKGADIIVNLSADNEGVGKHNYVRSLVSQQSARCIAGYVFASCGFGESTTDVVFGSNGLIYENGCLLAESERFVLTGQLVVSEIDVERLRTERLVNTTFAACKGRYNADDVVRIPVDTVEKPFKLSRTYTPLPFVPSGAELDERCREIFAIQVAGLAQRLLHTRAKTVVAGISGGLDSTLALLVCVKTFDKLRLSRKGIVGVTMPGFGTTDRTYNNAVSLMQRLGVSIREISIQAACIQHFNDIGHDMAVHDVTYENAQARERTQILMDIANQTGGFVVGTGDLSELALGWATYNGDHISMYGVNSSIPKTLVKRLVEWVAQHEIDPDAGAILSDIVHTPISPELAPAQNGEIVQKTEELIGPYELHDFILYHFLRSGCRPAKLFFLATLAFKDKYSREIIKKGLHTFFSRFFSQQFKRSCLPDGPKVGSITLSPRGDWRMPSDASAATWLREIEEIEEI
ncbi:MAG: NAD(+) synthase [Mediterranea sp.]|jgi:NAD+ synthase (glutamine-hydrolysing)|nr:NAD(+) synthase [Mediterranea sp.]